MKGFKNMIKIRLSFDDQADKEATLEVIKSNFDVKSISKDYMNRDNKSFRVYVDAELKNKEG